MLLAKLHRADFELVIRGYDLFINNKNNMDHNRTQRIKKDCEKCLGVFFFQ